MCWLYVPASLDWKPASNSPSQPLAQCVMWRGKPSPSPSRSRVFRTVISTMLQYGAMSKPSTAHRGVEKWVASLAAIPANHSVLPDNGRANATPDTSGPTSGESSEKSSQGSVSLKTWQTIFGSGLSPSSQTYAAWATELRQDSLRRQKLAPHINDSGSSSWPTPRTSDQHGEGGPDLRTKADMWATPTSRDHKDGASPSEKVATNSLLGRQAPRTPMPGQQSSNESLTLNPRFVEWLMGFPIGWTDLQPLETASYQQWQQQHGDNLERRR